MKHILVHLVCTTVMTLSCRANLLATEKESPVHETLTCSKEELSAFFPKVVVKAVLVKAKIPQDQADSIAEDLSSKDEEIDRIVKNKAAKLDPNPFHDLTQRDMAIKIYRESVFQEFAKDLRAHGITDDDKIQALLDEVQRSKSKLFIDCIRRENQVLNKQDSKMTGTTGPTK